MRTITVLLVMLFLSAAVFFVKDLQATIIYGDDSLNAHTVEGDSETTSTAPGADPEQNPTGDCSQNPNKSCKASATPTKLDSWGTPCKYITVNNGKTLFIPAKSMGEWNNFLSWASSNNGGTVSLNDCVDGTWSGWGACVPSTCGFGTETRTCVYASPYKGKDCSLLDGGNSTRPCTDYTLCTCGSNDANSSFCAGQDINFTAMPPPTTYVEAGGCDASTKCQAQCGAAYHVIPGGCALTTYTGTYPACPSGCGYMGGPVAPLTCTRDHDGASVAGAFCGNQSCPTTAPCCAGVIDCFGVCNGGAVTDCAGTCGGSAVTDCNGVCGGGAQIDVCGVCGGSGNTCPCVGATPCGSPGACYAADACGVCGGPGPGCTPSAPVCGAPNVTVCSQCTDGCGITYVDCNGCLAEPEPCSGATPCGSPGACYAADACGVCGGDGSSCAPPPCVYDCNGVCNGGAVVDNCGVCGGPGGCGGCAGTVDCNGVCNGGAVVDNCGVCGGPGGCGGCAGTVDCNGVCNGGAVVDACGQCGGDGSSCCAGGSFDCNGVCNGGAVLDNCGVCGGSGGCGY